MSLWDTIKTGLEQGLEILSDKSAEMSKLAKLSWERRNGFDGEDRLRACGCGR